MRYFPFYVSDALSSRNGWPTGASRGHPCHGRGRCLRYGMTGSARSSEEDVMNDELARVSL